MITKIRRNEIYLANLGRTIGSEERGIRPVLIIQNDIGNKYSPTTIVIPITKRVEQNNIIPTHIKIHPFGRMRYEATIMAEQLKVVDKRRLLRRIEMLPEIYVNKVNDAIRIATNLDLKQVDKTCFLLGGI